MMLEKSVLVSHDESLTDSRKIESMLNRKGLEATVLPQGLRSRGHKGGRGANNGRSDELSQNWPRWNVILGGVLWLLAMALWGLRDRDTKTKFLVTQTVCATHECWHLPITQPACVLPVL